MQSNLSKRINELLVLGVLESEDGHGYEIALRVEEWTAGTFSFQHGTLYPILHRLEKRGLVRGRWEEGARRRKTYHLTRSGRQTLREETERLRAAFGALFAILDGAGHEAA